MNGISIKVEEADNIGKRDNVRHVGNLNGSRVFMDDNAGELIICQPCQCLVITR